MILLWFETKSLKKNEAINICGILEHTLLLRVRYYKLKVKNTNVYINK